MLYAIKHPYLPLCKVGCTCDVDRRMVQYATHGLWVKPFYVTRGGRWEEKRAHTLLISAWETGEWFACSPEAVRLAMDAAQWEKCLYK